MQMKEIGTPFGTLAMPEGVRITNNTISTIIPALDSSSSVTRNRVVRTLRTGLSTVISGWAAEIVTSICMCTDIPFAMSSGRATYGKLWTYGLTDEQLEDMEPFMMLAGEKPFKYYSGHKLFTGSYVVGRMIGYKGASPMHHVSIERGSPIAKEEGLLQEKLYANCTPEQQEARLELASAIDGMNPIVLYWNLATKKGGYEIGKART